MVYSFPCYSYLNKMTLSVTLSVTLSYLDKVCVTDLPQAYRGRDEAGTVGSPCHMPFQPKSLPPTFFMSQLMVC